MHLEIEIPYEWYDEDEGELLPEYAWIAKGQEDTESQMVPIIVEDMWIDPEPDCGITGHHELCNWELEWADLQAICPPDRYDEIVGLFDALINAEYGRLGRCPMPM
jgi:hypothetical protein